MRSSPISNALRQIWRELREFFGSEYLEEFGEWDPQQSYGYASHDVHVRARVENRVVDHVGWVRGEIAVGTEVVAIVGVGGVLICADAKGVRLGGELMGWAEQSVRDLDQLAFDYLGCREQVVPFYAPCGWPRIYAREKSIGRDGESVVDELGPSILILPIAPLESWPKGDVDLRGRAL